MIRTAAALFARKTATVAVVGAVVLGGATLALAETSSITESDLDEITEASPSAEECADDPTVEGCPTDGAVPEEDVDCDEVENAEHEDCTEEGNEPEEDVNCDEVENADHEDCTEEGNEPEEGVDCDDDADHEDCTDEIDEQPEGGDLDSDLEQDEELEGERPDNHGKIVSAAARGEEGSGCEGKTGRDKGQCVSAVARGVQPPAEAPAEAPAEEPTFEAETVTAPAEKPGKPDHAGPPAGKGKGAKG